MSSSLHYSGRLSVTAFVFSSPDTYIQKTKKSYIDSRARRNLGSINTELQDVQRIMVANIEEVLQRGEALSGKSHVISDLSWGQTEAIRISTLTATSTEPSSISHFRFWFYAYMCLSFFPFPSPLSHFDLNSLSSGFSSLQRSTPRPATCPACLRSIGAMPSIWIPAPPMPSWQPAVFFSSCSLSTCASGGSEREREEKEGGIEVENELRRVRRQTGSLTLIRLYRHTTAHVVAWSEYKLCHNTQFHY